MHHKTLPTILLAVITLVACGGDEPADPAPHQLVDTPADLAPLQDMPDAAPDLATDLSAAGCPATDGASGPGTDHSGRVDAAQTWAAADSPHRISSSLIISEQITLTIEPCAVVLMGDRAIMEVRGTLDATGSADSPISFDAIDPARPFGALQRTGAGLIRLAHARVAHGGAEAPNILGMIDLRGDAEGPLREALRVDTVTLDSSNTFGVSLRGDATISAEPQRLTISNAASGPWRTTARLASAIPSGLYASNPVAEIIVDAGAAIPEDARWLAHDVPYRLSGPSALRVGIGRAESPHATLTLDPGVTLRFDPASALLVNAHRPAGSSADVSNGTLIALGTATLPITFEGATPTPGSWRGVVFRAAPTADSRLEHVVIAHAGGPSQANSYHCHHEGMGAYSRDEDAALTVFGPPHAALISSSTLRGSAADGINHAYSGDLVDLMPSNTFEGIARCNQTRPRSADGPCPQQAYCPK